MGEVFSRHRRRWIVVGLIFLLGASFVLWLTNSVHERAKRPQLIEKVHFLSKMLELYVADNGNFPEDLQTLVTEMHLDQRLLSPIADEKIEYFRPAKAAPGTTTVIVVTLGTWKIEVNKDFERHEKR